MRVDEFGCAPLLYLHTLRGTQTGVQNQCIIVNHEYSSAHSHELMEQLLLHSGKTATLLLMLLMLLILPQQTCTQEVRGAFLCTQVSPGSSLQAKTKCS